MSEAALQGTAPKESQAGKPAGETIAITCRDGYALGGHYWPAQQGHKLGSVIINPATGVLARYYHHYARFLSQQGFAAITYDYRGIGASRPPRLRGCGFRWRDWGELDFDAVVSWARQRDRRGLLAVVGHSIGGFLPGFADSAVRVDRFLSVGAQYAYWADYAAAQRARLLLKWHLAMPAISYALGYFPGRRLGWLEDLPRGVATEWSFRGACFEHSYPRHQRQAVLARFAAVRAPILAVGVSDDEFGTPRAIQRGLEYYRRSERSQVLLRPAGLGRDSIGHFGLFHARHREDFWQTSCSWLRDGINPWPAASMLPAASD